MKKLGEAMTRATLGRLVRLPRFAIDTVFGQPPENDRGHTLDHQTHALLNILESTYRPSLEELGAQKARDAYAMSSRIFDVEPEPLRSVVDERVDGPGGSVRTRIYRPIHDADAPALIYFHGGGFVVGDIDVYDGFCSRLAAQTECVVISVDYRLAPEHPFPAAIDDCVAAFEWAYESARRLGLDSERIAVGGDSAGGNLAAVTTQECLERDGPVPSHQLLFYPTTDSRPGYESMELFAEGYFLESSLVDWFTRSYLQEHSDLADPRVSPITYSRLADLPPTFVVTAGFDPLRDKGERYVSELEAAGVRVEHRSIDRLIHGFVTMGGVLDAAERAVDETARDFGAFLRQA